MKEYKVAAVIVAAGASSRMKSEKSKLFLKINNKSVIRKTLEIMDSVNIIDEIVVVVRKEDESALIQETKGVNKKISIAYGGSERQESVLNGVRAVVDSDILLIHDGARPLVTADEIETVIYDCIKYGAATLSAVPKDTVKIGDKDGFVVSTPERSSLRNIATPQVFFRDDYLAAVEKAVEQGKSFTDDCQLIENNGGKVFMTIGEYTNIKITTPEDIAIAEALTNYKERGKFDMRIGHGYDVHRLVKDRKLIIGGVDIPHDLGLLGHSDADVLLHAISDSLLGAAALGDIGRHFPDNDPAYEGADSLILLSRVVDLLTENGYRIVNIDATVIAQKPKLSPYIGEMVKNIAKVCKTEASAINIKATTEEGLGFTGNQEGISAHSVALICRG